MNEKMVFAATVVLEVLLGGSLVLTLRLPGFRAWPPPGKNSWQYYFVWVATIASYIGIVVVGILDWNSLAINPWLRYPVGILLMIFGFTLAMWGVRTLGIHTSQGLGGDLVREGPYRFTRNPQYVGDIAIIIGYIFLSNSKMALIVGILGILWFVLAPFAEEPWLRDQLGDAYDEYLTEVPRFILVKRRKDAG
ncbi:MAG: isoprenylcysteine carboxylmethyltransferase family protein [Chloroflexi bacterium]|nr:isoprenylcysteine carboxylmethyltransferase family protein [Chloroflexota bacterium]